jgi:hypothetical protein
VQASNVPERPLFEIQLAFHARNCSANLAA